SASSAPYRPSSTRTSRTLPHPRSPLRRATSSVRRSWPKRKKRPTWTKATKKTKTRTTPWRRLRRLRWQPEERQRAVRHLSVPSGRWTRGPRLQMQQRRRGRLQLRRRTPPMLSRSGEATMTISC
ncbi:hypothetical protein OC842_008061, partial [Tilletia horrida]